MTEHIAVVIPASGVGRRMLSAVPKQYLTIANRTVLEHTVEKFDSLPYVAKIIIVINRLDEEFNALSLSNRAKVEVVYGGKERANSVLNGVKSAQKSGFKWVMVHDAARPCVPKSDIAALYQYSIDLDCSAILGYPVRDTMKLQHSDGSFIQQTIDRNGLWHALTPQMMKVSLLIDAIEHHLNESGDVDPRITDEASALELFGHRVALVKGQPRNIKITEPDDLLLAEFYLSREEE